MIFGTLSYMATILVFAGSAVAIGLIFGWAHEIGHYKRLILAILVLGLAYGVFIESTALSWQIWLYNPNGSLNMRIFGGEAETYIYIVLVILAIVSATLFYADVEEKHGSFYKALRKRLDVTFKH